ncbi:MAG: PPC domain-containing protein [Chloroflexota bacterium]
MFRAVALLSMLVLAACAGANIPTATPPVLVQLIDFWKPVNGTLNPGDTQGWLFAGKANDAIRLHALSPAGDTVLILQSADGVTLAQSETIEVTLPADGTYTVLVHSAAGGQYELGLGYTDRPNPADYTPTPLPVTVAVPTPTPPYYARLGTKIEPIRSSETLSGDLQSADEHHVYTFDGVARQIANITLRRVSGTLDPVIQLFDVNGIEIASDDDTGGNLSALLRNIHLPADGTYSIVVSGHGFTGSYEVGLSISLQAVPITPTYIIQPPATREIEILTPTMAAANGTDLEDHIPVVANIGPGGANRFIVHATAGEIITIGVSPAGSGLRPKIEVYDPDGAQVATATAANSEADGDALVSALVTSSTGGYQVFVTGEDNSSGSFVVSYGTGVSRQDVRRGNITVDQTANGDIARRGLRDVWSLYLNTGDVISAAVSPSDAAFDPVLELTAPDGSLVSQDDNSGGGRASLITSALAPVSGLYHLRVTAAGGFGSGSYAIVWHYINLAATVTPQPGSIPILTFTDSITPGTYQFYTFQGSAGQQVEIRVVAKPGGDFDPVAALVGLDGQVIAEADDEGDDLNPRFTTFLPADGTYRVRVNGYLTGGDFTLTVKALFPAG